MLEAPDLALSLISRSLQQDFGLVATEITFLPLGVDVNAAVYRVSSRDDGPDTFLKLRRGEFNETTVLLTAFLAEQGVSSLIAPQPTRSGSLWGTVEDYTAVLYPFVAGQDGYEVALSDRHWVELGRVLRQIHDIHLPDELVSRLAVESFSPHHRDKVRHLIAETIDEAFPDPVAAETAAFLRERRGDVLALIDRAETLAQTLADQPAQFVVCHSDLHAGNVLIAEDARLFIVDWDEPILAPRECDLMYPGGAQGFRGHTPQQEQDLFFQGYNHEREPMQVDAAAIAYYRTERIIKDIAAYADEILLSDEGGDDRPQGLRYLQSNFQPGGTIEAINRSRIAQEGFRKHD